MKKIIPVSEYNAQQQSFHMTFHAKSGKMYTKGYVVVDGTNAQYHKSLAGAKDHFDKIGQEINSINN